MDRSTEIGLGLGGALVVGGGTLAYLHWRKGKAAASALAAGGGPAPSSGGSFTSTAAGSSKVGPGTSATNSVFATTGGVDKSGGAAQAEATNDSKATDWRAWVAANPNVSQYVLSPFQASGFQLAAFYLMAIAKGSAEFFPGQAGSELSGTQINPDTIQPVGF